MHRNNKLLKFLFIGLVITVLMSCFGDKKEEENIISLPDYKPKLEEVIGKYYFIPIKDEFYNRDDYKYFNLNKGDASRDKKDSTYSFNKFYFNQGESVTNLTGKLIIDKTGIRLSPEQITIFNNTI
ncbi:hypothetical protein J2795_002912 [Chryseobacterium bernardetii]|uniref:Uncharacterized protein n=2 Tax=Chryseobacterium TaxID=59732 RepID=A0A543EBU5_9FLAO|nr:MULTISPECIES: hypothetical protein [Chryseobacterium]MDR6371301.1 hypothetical protein [Chryseobacterium vietnamense]MDR6442194.1 hypothetical protein [Chryseobacterium bernardetii]TQM19072.1 hypothetical protein FB551_3467 [Chryseobacterium aquifrigidense]